MLRKTCCRTAQHPGGGARQHCDLCGRSPIIRIIRSLAALRVGMPGHAAPTRWTRSTPDVRLFFSIPQHQSSRSLMDAISRGDAGARITGDQAGCLFCRPIPSKDAAGVHVHLVQPVPAAACFALRRIVSTPSGVISPNRLPPHTFFHFTHRFRPS